MQKIVNRLTTYCSKNCVTTLLMAEKLEEEGKRTTREGQSRITEAAKPDRKTGRSTVGSQKTAVVRGVEAVGSVAEVQQQQGVIQSTGSSPRVGSVIESRTSQSQSLPDFRTTQGSTFTETASSEIEKSSRSWSSEPGLQSGMMKSYLLLDA